MAFVAILAGDAESRVAKYQEFDTLQEAQAHVVAVRGDYPDAFATSAPDSGWYHWRVNFAGKRLTFDQRPPPPVKEPNHVRAMRELLKSFDPTVRGRVIDILEGRA